MGALDATTADALFESMIGGLIDSVDAFGPADAHAAYAAMNAQIEETRRELAQEIQRGRHSSSGGGQIGATEVRRTPTVC